MLPRSKWPLLLLLAAFVALGSAVAQQSRLRPITAAKAHWWEKTTVKGALPQGTMALMVDPKQSFDLLVNGQTQMTVLSVEFRVPNGPVSSANCGVYLQPAKGGGSFFNPVSADLPIVCESITAVRLRRDVGVPPAFIFTGSFTSGSRAFQQRFTVSWDKVSGRYTLDSTGL